MTMVMNNQGRLILVHETKLFSYPREQPLHAWERKPNPALLLRG
jgi:hypothetical protein